MSVPQSPRDNVPPGSETGVYYIPVSNVSLFRVAMSLQCKQFKDFVRQACTVDRVEVFPRSTTGWVRVNGLDNFKKAMSHLDGGEFMGRALVADGRNENGPVTIRDIKLGPSNGGVLSEHGGPGAPTSPAFTSASWRSTPQLDSSSLTSVSNNSYGSYTTTSMGPDLNYLRSPDQHYTYPGTSGYDMSASYSQAPPTSMPTSLGYSQSPSYYGYSPAPSTAQYSYGGTSGASGSGSDYCGSYTDPPGMQPPPGLAPTAPPGGVVHTEQRGVFIREISKKVGQTTIDRLLRDTAAADAVLILDITIPVDKDRVPRGWATMMFTTKDAALRMVNRINKIEFKGRRLSAKVFKEGEAVGGGASGGGKHHGKKDKKDKGGSSAKWPSSKDDSRKDKDKKDSKKSVVIAHGSSYVKGKR